MKNKTDSVTIMDLINGKSKWRLTSYVLDQYIKELRVGNILYNVDKFFLGTKNENYKQGGQTRSKVGRGAPPPPGSASALFGSSMMGRCNSRRKHH